MGSYLRLQMARLHETYPSHSEDNNGYCSMLGEVDGADVLVGQSR